MLCSGYRRVIGAFRMFPNSVTLAASVSMFVDVVDVVGPVDVVVYTPPSPPLIPARRLHPAPTCNPLIHPHSWYYARWVHLVFAIEFGGYWYGVFLMVVARAIVFLCGCRFACL